MYADMMRLSCDPADDGKDGLAHGAAKGVSFTNKGDRAAVKYNFFKMCFGLEVERAGMRADELPAALARCCGAVVRCALAVCSGWTLPSMWRSGQWDVELLREGGGGQMRRGVGSLDPVRLSERSRSRRYDELPAAEQP